jgi:hypothetical protein
VGTNSKDVFSKNLAHAVDSMTSEEAAALGCDPQDIGSHIDIDILKIAHIDYRIGIQQIRCICWTRRHFSTQSLTWNSLETFFPIS